MENKKYTMQLRWHDEKHFGMWGGLYLMPEPNVDEVQCEDIAAICEHPKAEEYARLFAAAPKILAALKFYMVICGNTATSVSPETAREMYELGRTAIAEVEGEENNG